jgi:hypothetical protein
MLQPQYLIEIRDPLKTTTILQSITIIDSVDLVPTYEAVRDAWCSHCPDRHNVIRVVRQVHEGDPSGLSTPTDCPIPIHTVRWI